MKLMVIIPIILVMIFLRWRRVGILTWLAVWWLAIYVSLQYGFSTPIPQSVISLYMAIVTGVLLLYASSDERLFRQARDPVIRFVANRRNTIVVSLLLVGIPCLTAAKVYFDMTGPVRPPFYPRTIHPAPPDRISAFGRDFDMRTLDNPYRPVERTDPEAFRTRVENGRRVYFQNCFYCHGDSLGGDGPLAYGLAPIPTNFQDSGNIPMLQESFLFWRIAKGAPGLPEEANPWDSAMPAWEQFLSEEEIWDVILFMYDFTGFRPRAREELGSH